MTYRLPAWGLLVALLAAAPAAAQASRPPFARFAHGVDYRFETTVAGLRGARGGVRAVRLASGDELPADVVRKVTWENASKLFRHAVPEELQKP